MKRLLIHIGYPKTGSTSLQEGLFLKLHNQGVINFLGRTTTSTHSLFGNSRFMGEDWVVKIRKNFLFNKPLPDRLFPLRDDLINVISDEELTVPSLFHKAQFGIDRNPLDASYIYKSLANEADEVIIILTIRNQTDLIASCYLQKFRFLYSKFEYQDFRKFILNSDGKFRKDIDLIFNFNNVCKHYSSLFQTEVNLLVFEDLKYDRINFFSTLGNLMGLSCTTLLETFGNDHFRKKIETKEGRKFKVLKPSIFNRILLSIMGKEMNMDALNQRWYMNHSIFQNIEKYLLSKSYIINEPIISQDDKLLIFNHFKDENSDFAIRSSLDLELLVKYKYL